MNDELKLGSIVLVFCCFMWFYAIPNHIKGFQAALYPSSLIVALTILSGLFIVRGIYLYKTGERQGSFTFLNKTSFRSLIIVPMMSAYIFLIEIVGFYATTCLFIIIFMVYFGTRKLFPLCLFSTLLPLLVYLIIGKILSFPFPAGILF